MLRKLSLIVVGVLVATAALAVGGTATTAFATPAQVLSALKIPKTACDGFCNVDGTNHQAVHAAAQDSAATKTAKEGHGWHSEYSGANNCGDHACAEEYAAMTSVTDALRAGDAAALARILETKRGTVAMVAERHAVQVKGCDGQIGGNFPLTPSLETALTRLTH